MKQIYASITFDVDVISDKANYKKATAAMRAIEGVWSVTMGDEANQIQVYVPDEDVQVDVENAVQELEDEGVIESGWGWVYE